MLASWEGCTPLPLLPSPLPRHVPGSSSLHPNGSHKGISTQRVPQVLGLAGFGQEESRSIFRQVDADGGGSVDLEEFEAWWIESQRQQVGVGVYWVGEGEEWKEGECPLARPPDGWQPQL